MNVFRKLFRRDKPIANSKIVCVWIGKFNSEEVLYQDYLSFPSDDDVDDNKEVQLSKFAKDAGLGWYDEDFIESWWFDKLEINKLKEYRTALLDFEYFFDDLIEVLKTSDISSYNTITFLFGKKGANEMLFNFENRSKENVPIKFVLKKQYEI